MPTDADLDSKQPDNQAEYIGRWVEAIEAARADEKTWREDAKKAIEAFKGNKHSTNRQFNLYHSNIAILAPAIYNSTPIPDVRRRFGDSDAVAKIVADILERSLSFSMDDYDFDGQMTLGVYDMAITGRGVIRVRYVPTTGQDARLKVEKVTYQEVPCEYVPWERFIRGPAVTWGDVPWEVFEHFLSKEEVEKLAPEMVDVLPFNYTVHGKEGEKRATQNIPDAFKRCHILEIWDRRDRKVIFICPEHKEGIVREENDPLGLRDFFCTPRPMYAVTPVDCLEPVCPLTIYKDLLEELNEVTRRISRLVKQLRPRAGYAGKGLDMKKLVEADDGELIPLMGSEEALMAGTFDINRLIAWFPMEPTVLALRELLAQREAIKQTIYEVTGIADIMRGASDPRETKGAQELKAQFGSVRIRDMQKEVQRFARDLLRLKSEIISKHFEPGVLMAMTGIVLLPEQRKQELMAAAQQNPQQAQMIAQQQPQLAEAVQAPSIEQVMGLLRSPQMRAYRIDIETDSTIRGDMMRAQEQMAAFLAGTAQYLSAIGPMVKEGAVPREAAVELYAAFARQFQLGKSAEDALDKLTDAPPQQQQDPAAGEAAKAQVEAQAKIQIEQVKAQSQQQVEAARMQADQQSEAARAAADERVALLEAQLERERMQNEAALEEMKAQLKIYEIDTKDARERDNNRAKIEQQGRDNALKAYTSMETAKSKTQPGASQ